MFLQFVFLCFEIPKWTRHASPTGHNIINLSRDRFLQGLPFELQYMGAELRFVRTLHIHMYRSIYSYMNTYIYIYIHRYIYIYICVYTYMHM